MLTWLTNTIDPRPLGLARIIVGAAAIIRGLVTWQLLSRLADDQVLKAPYFDWLPDPNLPLAIGIVTVWLLAAILFAIGYRVAITGTCLLTVIVITLVLDQQAYSNHLYLMVWLVALMTLADSGAGINWSRADRKIVRWPVLLIMMQVSIVYGFSGLTKINGDFLSGRVLAASLRGGIIQFPEGLRTPRFLSLLAVFVIFVELFIAVFVWRRRFRPAAFVLGLALHVSISVLMAPTVALVVFSLEMLALYPLFLTGRLVVTPPSGSEWPERIRRFDLLRVVSLESEPDTLSLTLTHHETTTEDAAAHTRILEHLVPWLWLAPLLRLPGVRHFHQRFHRPGLISQTVAES